MILSNFFDRLIWLLNSLVRAVILVFMIFLFLTMMSCGPDQLRLKRLKDLGREKDGIYTIYNLTKVKNADRFGLHYIYLENAPENSLDIGLKYIKNVNINKSILLVSAVQIQKTLEGFSISSDPDLQDWTTIFNNKILFLRVKNDSIIEVRTNVKGEELKINRVQKDEEKIVYYKYKSNTSGGYNFDPIKSYEE